MRLAILADVHSNLQALEAVFEALADERIDEVICLGDVLGYNARPQECLHLIRERAAVVLLGNHDWAVLHGLTPGFNPLARAGVEHSRAQLAVEDFDYLKEIAPSWAGKRGASNLEIYHASPLDPMWGYVFPPEGEALLKHMDNLREAGTSTILALGHTHVPMLFQAHLAPQTPASIASALVASETAAGRAPITLLNPGSVGQPRDGDPRASFAVVDIATHSVEIRRVSYDVDAAGRDIRTAGLPALLAERLAHGR